MTLAGGLGRFECRHADNVLAVDLRATAAVPARCIPRCEKAGDPGDAVATAPLIERVLPLFSRGPYPPWEDELEDLMRHLRACCD